MSYTDPNSIPPWPHSIN
ncbi:unnamed protein product, partial [Adineta steineri]